MTAGSILLPTHITRYLKLMKKSRRRMLVSMDVNMISIKMLHVHIDAEYFVENTYKR
jgi:hypothetical protein